MSLDGIEQFSCIFKTCFTLSSDLKFINFAIGTSICSLGPYAPRKTKESAVAFLLLFFRLNVAVETIVSKNDGSTAKLSIVKQIIS